MPISVSGFPSKMQIVASVTFPAGFTITQFAKDSDPVDFPAMQIGDSEMTVNGHLVTWAMAARGEVTIYIIPGNSDDKNLFALFNANTIGLNKLVAHDVINATLIYGDGSFVTMSGGVPISYMGGRGINGDGKIKSRPYTFHFETLQESS